MMIDWDTDVTKAVFNSTLVGKVLIETSKKSIVILDFFTKVEYQQIAIEILNTSDYKNKLVFYDGCMMYNLNDIKNDE